MPKPEALWQAILADRDSPEDLKVLARRQLKLAEPPVDRPAVHYPDEFEYTPELEALVESYSGTRKGEYEMRDPRAERIRHALNYFLALGGGPNSADEVRLLLPVLLNCRSEFVRRRAGRALLTAYHGYHDKLGPQLAGEIRAALEGITDFDVFAPANDWLGLLQKHTRKPDPPAEGHVPETP